MRFGLREALFVLLLLAVPCAAYMFVFQPRNVEMAEAQREIKSKRAKLEKVEAVTQTTTNLEAEIDKLLSALAAIEQRLPAEHEMHVVLRDVEQLAVEHKLVSKRFTPDKPRPKAGAIEKPIRLELEGDFDGFYSFLKELHALPRITQISRLKIRKPKSDEAEGRIRVDMMLSVFYEDQSPEPTE